MNEHETGPNPQKFSQDTKEAIEKILNPDKAKPKQKVSKKTSTIDAWVEYAKAEGPRRPKEDEGYEEYVDYARKAGKPFEETPIEELYDAHKHAGENPVIKEYSDRVGERAGEQKKRNLEFQAEEDARVESEQYMEDLRKDLEAKRATYARLDVDISGRWNKLKKVLGFSSKEIKDPGVEEKKNEYKAALKKYMEEKRSRLGEMTKEQAAQLHKEFTIGEAMLFLNAKNDERVRKNKESGEWPDVVANGYMKMVEKWRGLNWKTKIAVSLGMMTIGAVTGAGLSFGAIGAGIFSATGIGMRILSGGASGVGLKKMMDTVSAKRETRASSKEAEKILNQDDWLNQINAKLDEAANSIDSRIGKMESKDLTRKRIAVYAGILVGSGAFAQFIRNAGPIGGFLKEKILGVSTAHASMIPDSEISGKYGLSGDGAEGEGYVAETKMSEMRAPDAEGKLARLPKTPYEELRTEHRSAGDSSDSGYRDQEGRSIRDSSGSEASESRAPDAEGKLARLPKTPYEELRTEHRVATDNAVAEDQARGGRAAGESPSDIPRSGGSREADLPQARTSSNVTENIAGEPRTQISDLETSKAQFEEIGSVKINKGGHMWGGIEKQIRANPEAFGLNPDDPRFKTNMNRRITEMLQKFATKNGLTYEQLDRVFTDDSFSIKKDAATGKIYIDDYKGKAFGGRFKEIGLPSGDIEASQQIDSLEGGKLVPKGSSGAGAAVEDMPRRAGSARIRGGGGQIPQEILEQERVANENWQESVKANKQWFEVDRPQHEAYNARELAMINNREYLNMRGSLKNIFNNVGISKSYDVFNQPMSKWDEIVGKDHIARDIMDADAVKISNDSRGQLNRLREIIEPYNRGGSYTIGECLKRSMEDPNVGKWGVSNGTVLRKAIDSLVINKK